MKEKGTYCSPRHHDGRLERILVSQKDVEAKSLDGLIEELRLHSTPIDLQL